MSEVFTTIMEVIMKKKGLIIALGAAASAITIAGCGGGGDAGSTATTTAETTAESTTTTTTTATTTAAETQATTEEKTTEATESVTTETATGSSTEADTGKDYSLTVKKAAEGFESAGGLSYSSPSAEYTYSVLNDVSNHEVESRLDSEAASLSDVDMGRIGDILYTSGKTDFGYNVTAYRYIGAGKTVNAYAGIQYLSEEAVDPSAVTALLSDEYISY